MEPTGRPIMTKWPALIALSVQLSVVLCASVNSNYDHRAPPPKSTAADSPTALFGSGPVEALCGDQFVHEHEVRSSITFDLRPNRAVPGPCRAVLTAPESNVFIVRLQRVAGGRADDLPTRRPNATRSCPLSIISTSDPLKSPWKIDPCRQDDVGAIDNAVEMLPGRLRVIWNHGGLAPGYRLIVTTLGRGQQCQEKGRHACLRFGSEIMLCVSDSLVCDGIRHCPTGNGYESDEDPEMCQRFKAHQTTKPPANEMGIWQHITTEIRKIMPSDPEIGTPELWPHRPSTAATTTTTGASANEMPRTKEARDRAVLTRGLARYGPWGYLMLGMLLCGGALLLCGMWECCCRTKKPDPNGDDPIVVSSGAGQPDANSTLATQNGSSLNAEPPNYDDFDPPPSYAILFPNQKAESTTPTIESDAAISATTAPIATTTTDPDPAINPTPATSN